MNYGSFYGGPIGPGFIIVKNYVSVQQMTNDFDTDQRITSEGVGFKEYVIINTTSEDNPDNGKIFRRGLDYQSSKTISYYDPSTQKNIQIASHGAEYICKITGSIASSVIGAPAVIAAADISDNDRSKLLNKLQTDGIWFMTEGG